MVVGDGIEPFYAFAAANHLEDVPVYGRAGMAIPYRPANAPTRPFVKMENLFITSIMSLQAKYNLKIDARTENIDQTFATVRE